MRSSTDAIYADCRSSLAATGLGGLEELRGARVMITGATGFVGTWLMSLIAYLNDTHGFAVEVTGVARRPSRLAAEAPFLSHRKDIALFQADVRQLVEIPAGIRWIVHAAANPDSRHHATNPIDTASVIADGTSRILRLAEQAEELRGLLHFSSGLVQAGSVAERRLGATSVYAEAKRFSEALCAAFRTQARLPVVVTRPFTFLGPFQALDAPWAANNFLHAAMKGQALKILGSGETARAYLYGSDMAVLALHQLVRGRSGETYDLGGAEAITLIELARLVVAEAGRPLEVRVNTAGRDLASAPLVPDMEASQRAFAFAPAFSPSAAIARTLAWHAGTSAGNA